jgi:hypothetical protein
VKKSALEIAAVCGSTSYGDSPLAPARLEAILRGATPVRPEFAQVHQALSETSVALLRDLAEDIDLPWADLTRRCLELFGSLPEEMNRWK